MATKKKNKKVKYAEFLAWLEGVESMQDPNWTPSPSQWKTIREKLNTVIPNVEIREIEIEVESAQHVVTIPDSTFTQAPTMRVPQKPRPLSSSPNQLKPSGIEGVPASNNGPFVDADGNLPAESEFE